MRTGLDPRHADQQLRGTALLPHGLGKTVRVLVFAEGEAARNAEQAGADFVGSDDLIKRVEGGWTDFDVALATRDMMGKVGRLGRVLGPRGLMPNPRSGTVVDAGGHRQGRQRRAPGPRRVPPRPHGADPRADRQGQLRRGQAAGEHGDARRRHRQGEAGRRQGPVHPRAPRWPPRWAPASGWSSRRRWR